MSIEQEKPTNGRLFSRELTKSTRNVWAHEIRTDPIVILQFTPHYGNADRRVGKSTMCQVCGIRIEQS